MARDPDQTDGDAVKSIEEIQDELNVAAWKFQHEVVKQLNDQWSPQDQHMMREGSD